MSSGKRYKFQGTTVSVQTGFGANQTITGISQADPAIVSIAAHGRAEGDVVRITGVVGMTEVNNRLFVVDDPTTGNFELAGVNSANFAAYVSGGVSAPVTFTRFCELTGVQQQDDSADEIEVTTICSTAKEFEVGLSGGGSVTLNYNWANNNNVQAAILAAKRSGSTLAIRIKFPGDGGTVVMIGFVQSTSMSGQVNGIWSGTAQIKITGEIFVSEL